MAEKKMYKLIPFEVHYECDVCKKGELLPDSDNMTVLTSFPPKYPHRCNNCGATSSFTITYPRIEFFREELMPTRTIINGKEVIIMPMIEEK